MKWHDCKTDPPKKNGHYILQTTNKYEEDWVAALFYVEPQTHSHGQGHWFDDYEEYICYDDYAYKWAEVELEDLEHKKTKFKPISQLDYFCDIEEIIGTINELIDHINVIQERLNEYGFEKERH